MDSFAARSYVGDAQSSESLSGPRREAMFKARVAPLVRVSYEKLPPLLLISVVVVVVVGAAYLATRAGSAGAT